jgi:hypothetical protein
MFPKRIFLLLPLLTLLFAALACNFSASSANIQNAIMATDETGATPTTVYAQQDTFFVVFDLKNAPDDTVVGSSWTAVEAEGQPANTAIDSSELTSGDAKIHFRLIPDGIWPVGKYKVDLFLNGELNQSVNFEVQGDIHPESTQPPAPTLPPAAASISNTFLARDEAGSDRTNVFNPPDTAYLHYTLSGADSGVTVKRAWRAVNITGYNPGELLLEEEASQTSGDYWVSLYAEGGLDPGQYSVELSINGIPAYTTEFEVSGDALAVGPVIANAYTTKDPASGASDTVFTPADTFYAVVELVSGAPPETSIKAVWMVVSAEGVQENSFIDEVELTGSETPITFSLAPNGAWPVGFYKVEIYANGALAQTLKLEVQP